ISVLGFGAAVSPLAFAVLGGDFGGLVSACENPVPGGEGSPTDVRREPNPRVATTSLYWRRAMVDSSRVFRTACSIPPAHPQALDVDASRQAAFHGGTDQFGRKEGERDRHVDVTNAASLARSDLFSAGDRPRDDLIEPAPASRDSGDQTETPLRPLWANIFSRGAVRQQHLSASF